MKNVRNVVVRMIKGEGEGKGNNFILERGET